MTSRRKMKTAVYSGSFDPLHIGHKAIMEQLVQDLGFDKVYLVVSPQNPFKDPSKAQNAIARYRAACEAVERAGMSGVTVSDIELEMEPPHYTIRTLDTLRRREPDNGFTLVVGADNLAVFRGWKDYRRILKEYGIVVFPRAGYDAVADRASLLEEDPSYRIDIVPAPLVNVSSTWIRNAIASGRDVSDLLM